MTYLEMVKESVMEYINNEINFEDFDSREELEEKLNNTLWICDSVTGNASGSFTFNSYQAKKYVCDDMETVKEALHEFGVDAETIADKFLSEDWEYLDVTARCYVLGSAISEALDELDYDFDREEEEEESENLTLKAADLVV